MNTPITSENGISPQSETPPNYGYELLAFTTALLLVVFIGLLPTLVNANLKQLPFCLISLAFVFGRCWPTSINIMGAFGRSLWPQF